MSDESDQMITRVGPDVESDALAAARFVLVVLAAVVGVALWIGACAMAFGAPGAFFAAVTGVAAIVGAAAWAGGPE